jgi:BMFP domain-containing protein YqiC
MRRLLAPGLVLLMGSAWAQEPTPGPASTAEPITAPDLRATPTPGAIPPALPRSGGAAAGAPTALPIGTGGTSLADIARRQKELREKEGKKPSLGVISNETLRKGAAGGEPPSKKGAATSKASPTPAARATAPGIPPVAEWRDMKGRTEADWRQMMAGVREQIAAAESRVKALEAEAKRFENDFYAWSDGNYRERVIRPAWDQAREELGKARQELDAARARLSELEEDARRSNAPPGWLR